MRMNLKKKSLILMLAVFVLMTFFTFKQETQAAEAWYTATIVATGSGYGNNYVCLTASGYFTQKYMLLSATQGKEQLATALTALSLGKTLYVLLDNALETPTIQAMYLIN
ncbi:MAG: hypothetical protein AB1585_13525 [Thermodesulfobacteriota bacterium]